eukprot:157469_1
MFGFKFITVLSFSYFVMGSVHLRRQYNEKKQIIIDFGKDMETLDSIIDAAAILETFDPETEMNPLTKAVINESLSLLQDVQSQLSRGAAIDSSAIQQLDTNVRKLRYPRTITNNIKRVERIISDEGLKQYVLNEYLPPAAYEKIVNETDQCFLQNFENGLDFQGRNISTNICPWQVHLKREDIFLVKLNQYFVARFPWNRWGCQHCDNQDDTFLSKLMVPPSDYTEQEVSEWKTRVVETRCFKCDQTSRWIRYSDPRQIFMNQTYGGTCGEFATNLAVLVNAIGYKWRFVSCVKDHIWLEVYSEALGYWIRIGGDPDPGLHYGMKTVHHGRNSPYIIGVGYDQNLGRIEVLDLSLMYTDKQDVGVLRQRRNDWHLTPLWMLQAAKYECYLVNNISYKSFHDLYNKLY